MDSPARNSIGDLWRWLAAKLKMIERAELMSDKFQDTVSHKLMTLLKDNLRQRAAKAWSRFDKYLELFHAFALQTPQEVLESITNVSGVAKILEKEEKEAAKIGMEYFFKTDLIDLLVDFVFGEKKPGDVTMGGSYAQPNFDPLTKVISLTLSQTDLIK
jgi:hypothetical protein